jgi:CheY-like chemotaxis protein
LGLTFAAGPEYRLGVPSPHIVVVDDDDAIRSIIVALAQEAVPSATVSSCSSGLRALQQIGEGNVDLLITNCDMPDMDGPTLIRTLRERQQSIPIIMVAGSDEARELGELAGVDCFVAKSALHTALAGAIQSLVEA